MAATAGAAWATTVGERTGEVAGNAAESMGFTGLGPAWSVMLMSLFGGLALFLFGMDQMADGLKSAAGRRTKDILSKFTSNRVAAALTGGLLTAVIQSSSITTVLVVGFVSAGLMTLTQSVGVIMGANVGTTLTAQLVAFNVSKGALALIAVGFAMLFVSNRDRMKQIGNIVMGLGLIFFGMGLMSDAMSPLREYPPFINLMAQLESPLFGILAGAAFTALVQSSSATTGVVIALASQGVLGLHGGIALIFGANIGTCVTAMLATVGKNIQALRVALVHVVFNVIGVLLWVAFIPQLAGFVEGISPEATHLAGHAELAAEVPRQVANAHAVFNITNTLLLLPFAPLIASLVMRIAPDRPEVRLIDPMFLDQNVIAVPALALHSARLETARLGDLVKETLELLRSSLLGGDHDALRAIAKRDDTTDALEGEILRFLAILRKEDLTDSESETFQDLVVATDAIESIGDVVSEDIVKLAHRWIDSGLKPSETARERLATLQEKVCDAFEDAIDAFREEDAQAAASVLYRDPIINDLAREVLRHQAQRFREADSDRLDIFRFEMRFVETQRRIFSLTKRVSRTVVPDG